MSPDTERFPPTPKMFLEPAPIEAHMIGDVLRDHGFARPRIQQGRDYHRQRHGEAIGVQ